MLSRLRSGRSASVVFATVWLLIILVPLYYMILAAFRSYGGYQTASPWIPGNLTFANRGPRKAGKRRS